MPSSNGPYQNNARIEWEWSVGSVSQNTTSVSVTVRAYMRMSPNARTNGNWPVNWSGAWGSGSNTQAFNLGFGARREIRSWSTNVSLTDSTQSMSFAIRVDHNFGRTSDSQSVSIPARYARTPTGLRVNRTSDTRQVVSWTRVGTYTSVELQKQTDTGSNVSTGSNTASGNAASFTSTVNTSNRRYRWRVRGRNSSGASAWTGWSGWVYTTPAAPGAPTVSRVAEGIRVGLGSTPPFASHYDVWDDATGTVVGSNIPSGSFPWVHAGPDPAVSHRYRIRARRNSGGESASVLVSGWSGWSATVQLQAAPNAPTNLDPNGGTVAADTPVLLSWRHNPVDASEQSQFQLRRRANALPAGDWFELAPVSSSDESFTVPVGFWLDIAGDPAHGGHTWQVRTKGAHADWSPWSATATVTVIDRPTVAVLEPAETWTEPRMVAAWSFDQADGRPQSGWRAELVDVATGETVASGSGTGGASSWSPTFRLAADTDYIVRVQVSASGLWSMWDESYFTTVFHPPRAPIVSGEWDESTGAVSLTVVDADRDAGTLGRNVFTNPRLEGSGNWVEVRRNLNPAPVASAGLNHAFFVTSATTTTATTTGLLVEFTQPYTSTNQIITLNSDRAIPLAAGQTISQAFDIRVPEDAPRAIELRSRFQVALNAGGTAWPNGDSILLPPGETRRLVLSYTATQDATVRPAMLRGNMTLDTGDVFELLDGWTVVYGDEVPALLSPNLPSPDPDMRVRWVGAENASASVMEIETVRGLTGVNAIVGKSTHSGKPAVRLIHTATSGSGYARFDTPVTEFTMLGTRHLNEPLTGVVETSARGLSAFTPRVDSEIPPNVAGSYPLRLHGTVVSSQHFRWWHGGRLGAPDVWWTDIGIYEGEYNGPPADGDTPGWVWEGEPGNSASYELQPPPTVNVVVERSTDGGETWTTVAIGGAFGDDMELSMSDAEAASYGINLYRVSTYAVSGSSASTTVAVEAKSPALWVGTGRGFGENVRLPYNPNVDISTGRERALKRYAGRTRAVTYSSPHLSKTITCTGTVLDHPGGDYATRAELETVVLSPDPVHLARTPAGDRIYGQISPVDFTRVGTGADWDTIWDYSFTVEETEA